MNILLIDDSPTIHRAVQIALDKLPYKLQAVVGLEQAFQVLPELSPQLIIVDAQILTQSAASRLADAAPILVLKGSFEELPEDVTRNLSYTNILEKPFSAETLRDRVALAAPMPQPSPTPEVEVEVEASRSFAQTLQVHSEASLSEEDLRQRIEIAVENYCTRHLKSLLREVLKEELNHLLNDD